MQPTEGWRVSNVTDARMTLRAGNRLGSYEIVTLLGRGGMGEVYRARDPKLNRDIALKVLADLVSTDPELLARFHREAQLLAALNHPNIAHIHGLEESNGISALVMELVDGPTLAERLEGGPIPLAETLIIGRQIAEALEAAHDQGIVHRDLKPANIKLRHDGVVKVLDFGLAKATRGDVTPALVESPTTLGLSREGMLLGTAPYMSPEQARGKAVDKRTDVWAFGCIWYEMLTGRRAFAGETSSDAIAAVLEREPDWLAIPPAAPQAIHRLLRRCLAKDPKRRLRDIGDARLEIDDAAAAPDATRAPASEAGRRYWTWVAAAVVAVAAFAIGRAWQPKPSPDSAPSFSRVVRMTSGPAQEKGSAISPDGKWIAYLSNARGPVDVWVKFLAGGEAANLTSSSGLEITSGTGITGLEISPDGSRIAVMAKPLGAAGQFETWEIAAPLPGAARKLLDRGEFGVRWSPDGRRMVFVRAGGAAGDALWIADADGSRRKELIPARGGLHLHWPAWAPDGYIYFIHTFATILNLDRAEIYRVHPQRGAMEAVVSTSRRAMFPVPMPDGRGLIYAANPRAADLSLWWRPMTGGETKRLTIGVGEYAEPRLSNDGRILVATHYELRQSLNRIAVRPGSIGEITSVTDGYGGDLDPTLAPATDQLVFTSSRSGHRNLWTAGADGRNARPLTVGSALDEQPAFSPDGQQIAFISDRGGERAIWTINADGGAPRKLVETAAAGGMSWSADGKSLIYAGGSEGVPTLWIASVDSGEIRPLATPGAGAAVHPTRCPTRDLIAYFSPPTAANQVTTLAFIDSAGRPMYTSLPPPPIGPGFSNGSLAWSPDGRHLAVVSSDTALPTSVWIVDPDAAMPYRKLLELPAGPRIRGITWTRDSSAVIVGKHEMASDIIMMDQAQ